MTSASRRDASFDVDAGDGLVVAAVGASLELAEGVEHVDEGRAPAFAESQAEEAGEPVMAVDDVVGEAFGALEGEEVVLEVAEVAVEVAAAFDAFGAGAKVDDADVGSGFDDVAGRRAQRGG